MTEVTVNTRLFSKEFLDNPGDKAMWEPFISPEARRVSAELSRRKEREAR